MCVHILSVEFTSVNINSTYTESSTNKKRLKSVTEVNPLKTEWSYRKTLGVGLLKAKAFRLSSGDPHKRVLLVTALLILTGLLIQNLRCI